MAFTRAEICRRFKERHPEKYTAEARREGRKKSEAAYRQTELYRESQRRYKESAKARNNSRLYHYKRKYNLTTEQVIEKYEKQGGLCGLCGKPLPTIMEKCHTDHDHVTGKVRDILHARCNLFMGFFERDPEILWQLLEYSERFGG
jgi:hypothetical protein